MQERAPARPWSTSGRAHPPPTSSPKNLTLTLHILMANLALVRRVSSCLTGRKCRSRSAKRKQMVTPGLLEALNLLTRRAWRPLSKLGRKPDAHHASSILRQANRRQAQHIGIACGAGSSRRDAVMHGAARTPRTLLAAMHMPMPCRRFRMPRSTRPSLTAVPLNAEVGIVTLSARQADVQHFMAEVVQ